MRKHLPGIIKSFIAIWLAITLAPMILDSCSADSKAEAAVASSAITAKA